MASPLMLAASAIGPSEQWEKVVNASVSEIDFSDMTAVFRRLRDANLAPDFGVDLNKPDELAALAEQARMQFNAMVRPIILYNQEVWGADVPPSIQQIILTGCTVNNFEKTLKFINETPAEQLHLKFNKILLGVNKQTSNLATRAETGNYPLIIYTLVSVIKYWDRVRRLPNNRLAKEALLCNNKLHENGIFSWTSLVKFVLKLTDVPDTNFNPFKPLPKTFFNNLETSLQNKYTQLYFSHMHNDMRPNNTKNKLRTYRKFKTNHATEKYLTEVTDPDIRASIAKMRTSSHNLMIEKGRHVKLALEHRICQKCNTGTVEDEFHAVMNCPVHTTARNDLFSVFHENFTRWAQISEEDKFIAIMSLKEHMTQTGHFFHSILNY